MIRTYPAPPVAEPREGQSWLFCDAEGCAKDVKITGITSYPVRDDLVYEAPMPKGWVTSDPEDNALAGAAQFCPLHADHLAPPVEPEPAPEPAPVEPAPPAPEPAP